MEYLACKSPYEALSVEALDRLASSIEGAEEEARFRFEKWLGRMTGGPIDWAQLDSPLAFVEALLMMEGNPVPLDFEPLFVDLWAHYPVHFRNFEAESHLWEAESVWAATCHWWSLRTETYPVVIRRQRPPNFRNPKGENPFQIGRPYRFPSEVREVDLSRPPRPVPNFELAETGFLGLNPFRPRMRDECIHIFSLYGLKPWFKDHNSFYFGGGDFDLSLARYGRGEWQLYFDVKGEEGRSVEFEESLSEALLAHLPEWPGVVEVILEDREAIWIKAKGWKKPAAEIRGLLDQLGEPFSGLTVDPKVESG
jgi:hypothetical protein